MHPTSPQVTTGTAANTVDRARPAADPGWVRSARDGARRARRTVRAVRRATVRTATAAAAPHSCRQSPGEPPPTVRLAPRRTARSAERSAAEHPTSRNAAPVNGATCAHRRSARRCRSASSSEGQIRDAVATSVRPWTRLARLATALVRKASASASRASSLPGSRYAALTSGIVAVAACRIDACEEAPQRVRVLDLAMLPRGLEAPRVRERPGRERGVDDLPGEPG